MRPVADEFETSQEFGGGATAGIVGNPDPNSGMAYYVYLYGNYQEFGHAGKDIACPVGTPIHAPADGTVLYAGWVEDLPGTGNVRKWLLYYNFGGIVTVIQHAGWISVIAHQSDNDAVSVGMQVKEGQLIGKSGNTKTRTTTVAPHVHIEALVYLDYRTDVRKGVIYGRVDPTPFFGGLAAQGSITQEDELSAADVTALQLIDNANTDRAILDMRAQVKALGDQLAKKIEDSEYDIKVWTQGSDNKTGDRIIDALRSDISAMSPSTIASLIPVNIAQAVADELAKRLVK